MKKLITAILLFTTFSIKAQVHPGLPLDQKYEYLLNIQGVSGKSDIGVVESKIRGKAGVTFFEANRGNHKYFILRSSVPLTQSQVTAWLNSTSYTLLEFATDAKQKEDLVRRLR